MENFKIKRKYIKNLQRWIALIMCFCLIGTVNPEIAKAEAEGNGQIDITQGDVVITSTGYKVGENDYTYSGDITINGNSTATGNVIKVESDARITLNNVIIGTDAKPTGNRSPMTISSGVNVTLNIEGNNSLGDGWDGYHSSNIYVGANASLTIQGSGTLKCTESLAHNKVYMETGAMVTVKSGDVNMRTSDGAATVQGNGTFIVDGGNLRLRSAEGGNTFGSNVMVKIKSGTMELYESVNAFGGKSFTIEGGELKSTLTSFTLNVSDFTFSGGTIDLAGAISYTLQESASEWCGMVKKDRNITMYGEQTLTDDWEIPSGSTLSIFSNGNLIIPEGITLENKGTLTIDGKITNSGTIVDEGTVENNGTIENNSKIISNTEISGVRGNQVEKPKYNVTVNNGSGSGQYVAGDTVTITVDDALADRFISWQVNSGNISLDNEASNTTHFLMPENDVELTATLRPTEQETKNKIVEAAKSVIGCQYVYGQTGPRVFDNAGLVYYAHKTAGVTIPPLPMNMYENWRNNSYYVEYETMEYMVANGRFKYKPEPGDIVILYTQSDFELEMQGQSASGVDTILGIYEKRQDGVDYVIGIWGPTSTVGEYAVKDLKNYTSEIYGVGVFHINSTGCFQIRKVDSDGNPLQGVQFTITLPDGTTKRKVTDANGTIKLERVESGTYKYQEISTIEGYELDNNEYSTFVYKGDTFETHTILLKGTEKRKSESTYQIINGANSSWKAGSGKGLVIRGDGEFNKFIGVKVDGKLIDESNYTVKEGSTIITLKESYLNSLAGGNHTVEIMWTDGSATTTFSLDTNTSAKTDKTGSPQTGDNTPSVWLFVLMIISGTGMIVTERKVRRVSGNR